VNLRPGFRAAEAVEKLFEEASIMHSHKEILDPEDIEKIDAVFDWLRSLYETVKTEPSVKEKHLPKQSSANSKIMASLLQKRTSSNTKSSKRPDCH
jgi:hypothetical protein